MIVARVSRERLGWLRDARHREITTRVSHPREVRVGSGTDSVHSEDQRRLAGICLVSLFMRFNIVIWHR